MNWLQRLHRRWVTLVDTEIFESEVLEWITELNVSKNGNHSSYLPENVGKFSLGNRMCVLLSDSRTLEKNADEMDARSAKGKRWTLARRKGNELADSIG